MHWPSCILWPWPSWAFHQFLFLSVQQVPGESKRQCLHKAASYLCFIFPPVGIQLHSSNTWQQKGIFSILSAVPMQISCIEHRHSSYTAHLSTYVLDTGGRATAALGLQWCVPGKDWWWHAPAHQLLGAHWWQKQHGSGKRRI